MGVQCSAVTRHNRRCLNHAEPPADTCGVHSGQPILTAYQKLSEAAKQRCGVVLTPSEVWVLYRNATTSGILAAFTRP